MATHGAREQKSKNAQHDDLGHRRRLDIIWKVYQKDRMSHPIPILIALREIFLIIFALGFLAEHVTVIDRPLRVWLKTDVTETRNWREKYEYSLKKKFQKKILSRASGFGNGVVKVQYVTI